MRFGNLPGRQSKIPSAFAAHILGHNHLEVNLAIKTALERGQSMMSSGTTEWEIRLAELRRECAPSLECAQFAATGAR